LKGDKRSNLPWSLADFIAVGIRIPTGNARQWNETMLDLDITRLGSSKRFEQMCFRLARYEFPTAAALAESWDGGRDVVVFGSSTAGDVVFQCKFIRSLIGAKAKIAKSLDAIVKNGRSTARWILCVPVDPSGIFTDWLQSELDKRSIKGTVWGASEILTRLEQHPDVAETFFYSVFSELADHFRSEHLELFKLTLDPTCQWKQADPKVLAYCSSDVASPDLVLDVIVRNSGNIATAITGIEAEVFDSRTQMHGLPGEGLLFPQITYVVSIHGGKIGVYRAECDPPLLIRKRNMERFKIRLSHTGYAWNGGVRLTLLAGANQKLNMPSLRLFA
jgi:hypothetical protein